MITGKRTSAPNNPTKTQIDAGYTLVSALGLTERRSKQLVIDIYKAMIAAAPEPERGDLTKLNRRIMEAIQDVIDETGYSPSLEEIAERTGTYKENMPRQLNKLEDQGYILRHYYGARSIQITRRI